MAKKEPTLEELLEAAHKRSQMLKQEQAASHDDLLEEFFDDYDDYEEAPASPRPQIEDLDQWLEQVMTELACYRFSQEDQKTLREFLTLHAQTKLMSAGHPEENRAYYNLMIRAEEPEAVRSFAKTLSIALGYCWTETHMRTEKEMLQKVEESRQGSRRLPPSLNLPRDHRFILVDQCQDAPRLNMDGGASARDASIREMENYQVLWNSMMAHTQKVPGVILLVSGDEDVYRNTLRPFIPLSQRVCCHHIRLAPRTEEELLQDCLEQLQASSFSLSEDFAPALEKYFYSTYQASELRNTAFVTNLIDQIFERFYICKRQEHVLDASCIPVYDPMAQSVEQVLGRLDRLVGLQKVKEEFHNLYRLQMAGLSGSENARYHMLFAGNPGTGKTTVARMAADLFFRMGVTKSSKLVVVKPADMISDWVGGTGSKAMEIIRRAYNGVLFIDEAYGIANMDRGYELLNVLLQEMENNGHRLVVILAGYTEEMRHLLKANPGLASRISQEIHFEDYSQEELVQIFLHMCKTDGFTLDPSARDELEDCIAALMTREFFGNARDIRNMLQDLKEVWSQDYYEAVTSQDSGVGPERVFLPRHFEKIQPPKKELSIHDLIGLDVMKKKLEVFKRQAMYQKHLREKGFTNLSDFSLHMIFTGNPGTGKTSVAKLIADDLYAIGMLKTNRLVVAERKDLVGIHGDTGAKTADVIRKAVGGVLFIDEAYSLAGSRYDNQECIEVLLTAMEEHKKDTVFIFAGYVDRMQEFLMSNPGIQSRIGYTFHFEDYTPDELTKMYADKMKKMGFAVSDGALRRVRTIMEYFQDVEHFGNGRFVNHVIHQTISQRSKRNFTRQYRDIQTRDIPSFKTLIETAPNGMHLYDPAKISAQEHRRTAIHELGHAVVMVGTDPENVPKSISIRNWAGSYGRVALAKGLQERTEQQLFHHIATLLGGKNAEKCILGTHSVGCSQDYQRAKNMAENMIEKYAMNSFGADPGEILKAADGLSAEIISRHKQQIEALAQTLLDKKEISGEAFMEALKLAAAEA